MITRTFYQTDKLQVLDWLGKDDIVIISSYWTEQVAQLVELFHHHYIEPNIILVNEREDAEQWRTALRLLLGIKLAAAPPPVKEEVEVEDDKTNDVIDETSPAAAGVVEGDNIEYAAHVVVRNQYVGSGTANLLMLMERNKWEDFLSGACVRFTTKHKPGAQPFESVNLQAKSLKILSLEDELENPARTFMYSQNLK